MYFVIRHKNCRRLISENKASQKLKFWSNITNQVVLIIQITKKKRFRNISIILANLQPPNWKLHNRNDANIQTIGWSNSKHWSLIMSWFSFQRQFLILKCNERIFCEVYEMSSFWVHFCYHRGLCCKVSFCRPT